MPLPTYLRMSVQTLPPYAGEAPAPAAFVVKDTEGEIRGVYASEVGANAALKPGWHVVVWPFQG